MNYDFYGSSHAYFENNTIFTLSDRSPSQLVENNLDTNTHTTRTTLKNLQPKPHGYSLPKLNIALKGMNKTMESSRVKHLPTAEHLKKSKSIHR
jgi:hypothetical protein